MNGAIEVATRAQARFWAIALPAALIASLLVVGAQPAQAATGNGTSSSCMSSDSGFSAGSITSRGWDDGQPVGSDSATGQLHFPSDHVTGGSWNTDDGDAFAPASDKLTAGMTLVHTVNTTVTARGDNLTASIRDLTTADLTEAQLPESVRDQISVSLASDPVAITGAVSDASGEQTVALRLRVTADDNLDATAKLDLTAVPITLTNGHGWTDTATLDAGTLETGATPAPGGTMSMQFNLRLDDDGTIGFYLTRPAPGTIIKWGIWDSMTGAEVTTEAVDGLNSMDYGNASTSQPTVEIIGAFRGLGSKDQTESLIGALTYVNGWSDSFGSTSARYAFKDATNLSSVTGMPNGLTDTSYAFQNAGIHSDALRIQSWTAENVTTMAHMFDGATSFTSWSLATQWSTSNVRDMSYMFAGASSFNIPLATWDTSRVTTMEGMFLNARSFGQDLSGWDVNAVTAHTDFATGSAMTPEQIPRWTDTATQDTATQDAATPDTTSRAADDASPNHDSSPSDNPTETDEPSRPAEDAPAPEDPADTDEPDDNASDEEPSGDDNDTEGGPHDTADHGGES